MRKWLKPILVIFLCTAICVAAVAGYNAYRQHEAVQQEELLRANEIRRAQVQIMIFLGYYEYYPLGRMTFVEKNALVSENYEKFLERESLLHLLHYYKALMDKEYPEVGYGVEHPEITLERLRTENPLVLQAEVSDVEKKLFSEYANSSAGIIYKIYDLMRADGLDPYA